MEVQSFQGLAHSVQTVALAALIAVACYYFPKINLNAQLAKLPSFGTESGEKQRTEFLKHGKDMYLQGYEKVHLTVHMHLSLAKEPLVQESGLSHDHLRWYQPPKLHDSNKLT